MTSISQATRDLLAYLESLVRRPGPPARLLGVGWRSEALRERLARSANDDVWINAIDGDLEAGRFDMALWNAIDVPDVASAAAAFRDRLIEGGRLVVVVAAEPSPAPRADRRRGGLATAEQQILRAVLLSLSETGFQIGAQQRLGTEGDARVVVVARKDPFTIRSYRAGDEAAILELFPTCFHVERSLEHWRWKYLGNPFGALKISMALARDGELAAHYASYPMPFWVEESPSGRDLLALQMGDTMTAPRFREEGRGRNGLLPRTVRHFFSIHRDGSYAFYYGFNTGPIQRFCQWFIGGDLIAPVAYWARDLEGEMPGPVQERYRVRRVLNTHTAWDRFFRQVAPHYGFLVRRDARWVDWRYLSSPDAEFVVLAASRWGRLAGWSVFRRQGDLLIWGDALFDPRHVASADAILAEALRHPALAGARRLVAWFPERPRWWSEELPALGLHSAPEPDGLGMVALEDGEANALEKLSGLYYTMGDGDLF